MPPFILVDFDDTLVDTGPRFHARRERLFRFLEAERFPNPETAREAEALAHFRVGRAEAAWMVGNSIRSDVNPALAVGARATWIDTGLIWHHDRARPIHQRFSRATSFPEAVRQLLEGLD